MDGNVVGFLLLLAEVVGIALVVYFLLRGQVRALITPCVGEAASAFFVRVLLLGLLLAALGGSVDTGFNVEVGSPSLEYVWRVASGLSGALTGLVLFLFGYVTLLTVLVSALGRRGDG